MGCLTVAVLADTMTIMILSSFGLLCSSRISHLFDVHFSFPTHWELLRHSTHPKTSSHNVALSIQGIFPTTQFPLTHCSSPGVWLLLQELRVFTHHHRGFYYCSHRQHDNCILDKGSCRTCSPHDSHRMLQQQVSDIK